MASNIKKITKKLIDFRDVRDWKQFHNPKDVALSLSLEAAEVLEHFQWKNGKELEEYVKKHKDEIGEELADVFNWVLVLSDDIGIDIIKASEKKIAKNGKKYPVRKAKGTAAKYTKL
jgi:NTP pyrophosphatase (non-canonical NTP hydrolase)